MIHWVKDTAANKVDIYADNDNILHYPVSQGYGRKGKPEPGQKLCDMYYVTHPNKNATSIYEAYKTNRFPTSPVSLTNNHLPPSIH